MIGKILVIVGLCLLVAGGTVGYHYVLFSAAEMAQRKDRSDWFLTWLMSFLFSLVTLVFFALIGGLGYFYLWG